MPGLQPTMSSGNPNSQLPPGVVAEPTPVNESPAQPTSAPAQPMVQATPYPYYPYYNPYAYNPYMMNPYAQPHNPVSAQPAAPVNYGLLNLNTEVVAPLPIEAPVLPQVEEIAEGQIDNIFGLLCIFTIATVFTYILNKFSLNFARKNEEKPVVTEEKIIVSSDSAKATHFDL